MTFWLFLISFALPLPLRRCHQQPSSAVFLFLLESGWNNATSWCNIMQNCVRASGGTQRPSAITAKWPEELRTGQSLWVDGAKQGRGNNACFGAVRLKVIYDVLWQAWTICTLFFLILLCRRMHSCLAPCFWWNHQCYLNPVNKYQEEFMPWDAECHCSVKPLHHVWSTDLKFSILRDFRESWLSQTCLVVVGEQTRWWG